MADFDQDADYKIGATVDSSEVPNWARREPKWQRLIEAIAELKPRQSLTVTFPNRQAANRARNTVRDTINLRTGLAVIRTRMIDKGDHTVVYFTRLPDDQVVQEERDEPDLGNK